jgi:hypothetical protein
MDSVWLRQRIRSDRGGNAGAAARTKLTSGSRYSD